MTTMCGASTSEVDKNWTIPIAAFFLHFSSLGMQYSIGLYFLPLIHEFNSDRATISLMGSLCLAAMFSLVGIASGYCMDRFDSRVLLLLASMLLSLGLLCGSYAEF